ncbi:MAG: exodeoxyribonuclease V subunit alpha, partial [Leptospirales bacterium]|nr:exodeoxyribonuclease V subunit alpha [Leptospirales bacterium]
YYGYEKSTAKNLKEMALASRPYDDKEKISQYLDILFPSGDESAQKAAAIAALGSRLTIISGGPGTGKTTTAAKILFLFLLSKPSLSIALTAPTGKAAVRMMEAVSSARLFIEKTIIDAKGATNDDEKKTLEAMSSLEGSTMHRLLGTIPASPYFRHNSENPLGHDLVVIDEASMIDIAMMAKFLDALPKNASCIILGDKEQLSSVEAGAVMFDICESALKGGALEKNVILLTKSWRFAQYPGIGALSKAVNTGAGIKTILDNTKPEDGVEIVPDGEHHTIAPLLIEGFSAYIKAIDIKEALNEFSRFRILAPLREGRFGVNALNLLTEEILENAGLIRRDGSMYINRPLMVTKNDYQLGLFNGDIGLVRLNENGERRVFFQDAHGGIRSFAPSLLPEHETVFAMTIHKSQGSEFGTVLLALPEKDSALLTKEILYTGITRAKNKVLLLCKSEILQAASKRNAWSASGLIDALL